MQFSEKAAEWVQLSKQLPHPTQGSISLSDVKTFLPKAQFWSFGQIHETDKGDLKKYSSLLIIFDDDDDVGDLMESDAQEDFKRRSLISSGQQCILFVNCTMMLMVLMT